MGYYYSYCTGIDCGCWGMCNLWQRYYCDNSGYCYRVRQKCSATC